VTRVLFLGDVAQTGFGTVTLSLGRELLALGLDLRFCSLNEPTPGSGWWSDLPEEIRSRTASLEAEDGWLAFGEPETAERLAAMFSGGLFADGWTPDAAIILGDPGSLEASPVLDIIPDGLPVLHYVPIEGIGSPPAWRALWQKAQPVPTSRFGAMELERLLGRPVPYVYHGVDTQTYHRPSREHPIVLHDRTNGRDFRVLRSQRECKEFFGLDPARFLILRTDRLMPRKRYPSLLRSLAVVMAQRDEVDFLWHCRSVDQGGNLFTFRSQFPLDVARRMQPTGYHDQGLGAPAEMMAALYAAADIYVSTSAEGFGLTIAEAMACGTPVVAMDYSSVPEVLGADPLPISTSFTAHTIRQAPGGLLVPPAYLDDNIYGYWWAAVNERLFASAVMGVVMLRRQERQNIGARGAIHVGAAFRWSRAAEQFRDLIMAALPQEVAA
jgi:glycosyltransferase involved in cell wall biosynthesis